MVTPVLEGMRGSQDILLRIIILRLEVVPEGPTAKAAKNGSFKKSGDSTSQSSGE